jgi:hypothetical protein
MLYVWHHTPPHKWKAINKQECASQMVGVNKCVLPCRHEMTFSRVWKIKICSHIPCLYKAMPAHIDILLTSANNQLGRIISPPLSRGVLLSVVQGVWCLFDSEVDCLRWLACLCLYSIMNTCKDLKIKLSWNWISENPLDLQDSKHPQSILAYYLLPLCTKCMEPYKQWRRQPYCLMTRSAQPHVYMHMFCLYVISILYQLLDEY